MQVMRSSRTARGGSPVAVDPQAADVAPLVSRQAGSVHGGSATQGASLVSAPDELRQTGASTQVPQPAKPQSQDLDVDDLVERAWSAFMLRLTIEHERRGFGRWS
jgi:hypothetical protein